MDIHPSARKHGVADDDIRHAVRNAMATDLLDEDLTLHLGPDRSGRLLEVISVRRLEAPELAIHAMPMRPKYESLLERS